MKKISVVTQIGGNVQIFSSPKATTKPLPEIEGPVTVSFKREDEFHGMALGPVTVGCGETPDTTSFGSIPEGCHDLGWVTKHVAQEIAAHYGVALKES